MKIKYLMYSLFLGCTLMSYAQDADFEGGYYKNIQLPRFPIDAEESRTYSIRVNNSGAIKNQYSDEYVKNKIDIVGLKEVADNAEVEVNFNFNNVTIESNKVDSKIEVTKDDDGKVTDRTKYYRRIYSYRVNASTEVNSKYLPDQSSTIQAAYGGQEKITRWSKKYPSTEPNSILKERLTQEYFDILLSRTNSRLNEFFGYPTKKHKVNLFILDSKKHPHTAVQKGKLEELKSIFSSITPSDDINELESKLKPYIEYFDDFSSQHTGDKRKDRRMKYLGYYNNAYLYSILNQPAKVREYANMIVQNKIKEGDGEFLLKKADKMEKLLLANNRTSTYFEPTIYPKIDYGAPVVAKNTPTNSEETATMGVVITISNDSILANIPNDLEFKKDTKEFIATLITTGEKTTLPLSTIKKIFVDDENQFVKLKFTSVLLENKEVTKLVKQIITNKNGGLYQFDKELILIDNTNQKSYSSLNKDFIFNMKGKLREVAGNCTEVVSNIDDGKYKINKKLLGEFVKDLGTCSLN